MNSLLEGSKPWSFSQPTNVKKLRGTSWKFNTLQKNGPCWLVRHQFHCLIWLYSLYFIFISLLQSAVGFNTLHQENCIYCVSYVYSLHHFLILSISFISFGFNWLLCLSACVITFFSQGSWLIRIVSLLVCIFSNDHEKASMYISARQTQKQQWCSQWPPDHKSDPLLRVHRFEARTLGARQLGAFACYCLHSHRHHATLWSTTLR